MSLIASVMGMVGVVQAQEQAPLEDEAIHLSLDACESLNTKVFLPLLQLEFSSPIDVVQGAGSWSTHVTVTCLERQFQVVVDGQRYPKYVRGFDRPSMSSRGESRLLALAIAESVQDWRLSKPPPLPPMTQDPVFVTMAVPKTLKDAPPTMFLDLTLAWSSIQLPGTALGVAGRLSDRLGAGGGWYVEGQYIVSRGEGVDLGQVEGGAVALGAGYLYRHFWSRLVWDARVGWRGDRLRLESRSTLPLVQGGEVVSYLHGPVLGTEIGWLIQDHVRVIVGGHLGWLVQGLEANASVQERFGARDLWGQVAFGVGVGW